MPARLSTTTAGLAAVVALLASLLVALVATSGPADAAAPSVPTGLRVSGNSLLTGSGSRVVLRGVDRAGTEYACIQGWGIFDGPSDAASIAAIAAWHVNAVRVPLNEDCWLGINGANPAYSGANYRTAIAAYVQRLHAAGLIAIVDLHWTAAGTARSTGQQQMADADHAPAFWKSVATTFKSDTSTVFDLFNEPHDVSWTCWRNGGDCGIGYRVAGMQTLVNAVRATGATNPVLVGGLAYANDLPGWLRYRPSDPAGNLMASWHSYNFNSCSTASCWNAHVAPVAAAVPLVTGEVGENDCGHGYLDRVLPWLDAHAAGYLGWGWNTASCSGFPALITSYAGAPTAYGAGLRDHLAALAPGAAPTAPTTDPTTSPAPSQGTWSVTPTAQTGSAPWWWEHHLDVAFADTVTTMTLTVTVRRTPGLAASGWYSTLGGDQVKLTSATGTKLVYRATLKAGQTLPAGSSLRVGAQSTGDGSAHDTTGDTYTVQATVGGRSLTATGHF